MWHPIRDFRNRTIVDTGNSPAELVRGLDVFSPWASITAKVNFGVAGLGGAVASLQVLMYPEDINRSPATEAAENTANIVIGAGYGTAATAAALGLTVLAANIIFSRKEQFQDAGLEF